MPPSTPVVQKLPETSDYGQSPPRAVNPKTAQRTRGVIDECSGSIKVKCNGRWEEQSAIWLTRDALTSRSHGI